MTHQQQQQIRMIGLSCQKLQTNIQTVQCTARHHYVPFNEFEYSVEFTETEKKTRHIDTI